MLAEAVECEVAVRRGPARRRACPGMSLADMRVLPRSTSPTGGSPSSGSSRSYGSANPFAFMELQDVQELSNFFERRVSAYQVGVSGTVSFDDDF